MNIVPSDGEWRSPGPVPGLRRVPGSVPRDLFVVADTQSGGKGDPNKRAAGS